MPPSDLADSVDIVLLRSDQLLEATTLLPLAQRDEHGIWRDRDGVPVDALVVPVARVATRSDPDVVREHFRSVDAAWCRRSMRTVRALATDQPTLTSEDVRDALDEKPRDARTGLSQLMKHAQRAGVIELTDDERAPRRANYGGRRTRVWRSLLYQPRIPLERDRPPAGDPLPRPRAP